MSLPIQRRSMYREVPVDVLENREQLAEWAIKALLDQEIMSKN
ncbi:hypothetical protein ACPUYX_17155 [Desulfosporosinus sp. SYSU MS00001]